MMARTTLREIKQSFGRYFAILAIVALGVAFFAGLKVTKADMIASADDYFTETQLFDYRLLSTLGFEEEDVEALLQREDVRAAEGALSADIICVNSLGNENVIKAHSLTEDINKLMVTAGRLPESPEECVVDSNLFDESAIGSKLVLSENNEQDDLDNFVHKEYTITGIVQSPYYVQFERGNSSIGNGRISGFMYLLPEAFTAEYYTEIFIKFEEDYTIYSDEYEAYMDEKEALWEEYCKEQAFRRYHSILAEAETELSDAEEELAEKKAKAESELADAKEALDEADAELIDGEDKLADAKAELADAEDTIAEKEEELADAKQTLLDNEALLEEKQQEYEDGMAAFTEGKQQIEKSRRDLDDASAQIAAGEKEIRNAQAQIDAMKLAGYPAELIAAAQAQLDAQKAEADLEGKRAQVQAGYVSLSYADATLNSAYMQLEEGAAELADAKEELADAKQQIADGETELADAKKELADARKELSEKETEWEEGKVELSDGYTEYYDAYDEFQEEVADAEQKIADARAEVADIKKPDTYVLDRKTNVGYACFENDASIVEGIANVFPVFFFLVAALVCMTTMNRMVEEQRTQIGVLKALGYGEGRIMGKYLFYSGSAAITGSITGFLLGTHFFPLVIWTAYGIMYRMDSIIYVFDWKMAAVSLFVSVLCSMGTTWFSCSRELREVAAGLMRPKAPKAGKRVFLERVPFIWKRLKFLQKVSVRNIVRYKKRFFMMVIGISGCTALLVMGFGVRDSVTDVADQQFEEIQLYQMGITLQEAKEDVSADTEELLEKISGLGGEYLFAMEKNVDLVVDGQVKSISMITAQEPDKVNGFIDLHTKTGEAIAYPGEGEVVLSDKLAEVYDIGIGDEILLRDEDMQEIRVKVTGICQNFISNYAYIHPDTFRNQVGEPEYKSLYVTLSEDADVHAAGAAVMPVENVTAVTVNEDMLVRISSMMDSMNYIVIIIIFCAAALAFIVLYNLNNINITERIREIATIKVLGFYRKETATYVFRENMILTGIGCAAGLLLGKGLHAFVMHEINIDMVSFDVQIKGISYLFSILLTFAFAWVVNRIMSGKLERINMAESLKSVD